MHILSWDSEDTLQHQGLAEKNDDYLRKGKVLLDVEEPSVIGLQFDFQ